MIAKFESREAQADGRNRMEWATLRMARDMGMPVPQHELVDLGDHVALVLERLDRVPTASGMRRRHYVSAASFISAVPQSQYLASPFDQAMFSWRRLMDVASAVGASASRSRIEVFGRLMLNAAVGNSDDHLGSIASHRERMRALSSALSTGCPSWSGASLGHARRPRSSSSWEPR